ncbi:MAG: hypothetical protein ACJZ72_02175 [Opitutales bacterium]
MHAETQAIAAKELDIIESILQKKDESLEIVLTARDNLGVDPRTNQQLDSLIDRVIELQKRNADSFQKLVNQQNSKASSKDESKNLLSNRLKQAYSGNNRNSGIRLD